MNNLPISKPFKITVGVIILLALIVFTYPSWRNTQAGYHFCSVFGKTEFTNGLQTCTFLYTPTTYSDLVDLDLLLKNNNANFIY
jgi:hypothetical protein